MVISHIHKFWMEIVDVKVPRSPSSTLDDVECKSTDVDDNDSSHVFVTHSFENHTTGIGSQLVRKMRYTRGGVGRNRLGIFAPIRPIVKISSKGFRYYPPPTS